jgi:hypothetical protein
MGAKLTHSWLCHDDGYGLQSLAHVHIMRNPVNQVCHSILDACIEGIAPIVRSVVD